MAKVVNYYKKIRLLIREFIDDFVEEERIPNTDADDFVDKKQNFIGSHTYGENIGDLNKMYVAYSYGQQHPLFVWVDKDEFKQLRSHEVENLIDNKEYDNKKSKYQHLFNKELKNEQKDDEYNPDIENKKGNWFYNERPYYVKNKKGKLKPNKWTIKHLHDLKPNEKIQARDTIYLRKLIRDFKKKYNIGRNKHSDTLPGEK